MTNKIDWEHVTSISSLGYLIEERGRWVHVYGEGDGYWQVVGVLRTYPQALNWVRRRALGRAVHNLTFPERTPRPGRPTPRAISGPVNWDGVSLMNYHDDYFLSRSPDGVNIQVHKYREYPELVQECDTFPAAMQWVRELMGKSELPANTEIG